MRDAEIVRGHVEHLLAAKTSGGALPVATAQWLSELPAGLRGRLVRLGLAAPTERRDCPTVAEWVGQYIAKRADVKPNTIRNMRQAADSLIAFFGAGKRLDEITAGDAQDFALYLRTAGRKRAQGEPAGLAKATWNRRLKRARQFLGAAVAHELIPKNPFAAVKTRNVVNRTRDHFIGRADAEALLAVGPDAEWRAIVALCRYGGLRCPSEVMRLEWGDIDWAQDRFTVHSPKKEQDEDAGARLVPLFGELRPYLMDAFAAAEDGARHVVARHRCGSDNLRTGLRRIIARAGLTPWPKLFQNLRATRRTELEELFPGHVLDAWLGHSEGIAREHYLQVTAEHFAKAARIDPARQAARNPARLGAAMGCNGTHDEPADGREPAICGPLRNNAARCIGTEPLGLPPRGLEPLSPG